MLLPLFFFDPTLFPPFLSCPAHCPDDLGVFLCVTDKEAQEADRHGRHGDDSNEAGPTKGVLARRQREQLQSRLRQERDTTKTTAHPDLSRVCTAF